MIHGFNVRGVVRDERGAVMLMGVFFAIFLAGAAYYLVGVGEAILHRQRMQDAADAGAFAAAVLHARGMNIIALINTMMSALLSVLVLLKLMEALLTIAILALSIAAFFSAGSTSGLIAPLTRVRNVVQKLENRVEPVVNRGLKALHWASKSVRVLMPTAAEFRVVDTVMHEYGDVAHFGFALPMSLTLPVEPDKFSVVCGEAGKIVGDLATVPVRGLAPEVVLGTVESAAKSLTESLQAYFCGGSGEPPTFSPPEQTLQLPKLASRKACEDNQDPSVANKLCREAAIDEAQGEPQFFKEEHPGIGAGVGDCKVGPVQYGEPMTGTGAKEALKRGAGRCRDYAQWSGGASSPCNPLTFHPAPQNCDKYQEWVNTAVKQCNPYAAQNPYHGDLSNFVYQTATQYDWWTFVETPSGPRWTKEEPKSVDEQFGQQSIGRGDLPSYCAHSWDESLPALCVSPKSQWRLDCSYAFAPDGSPLACPAVATAALPKEARVGSRILISYPVVRRMLGCETKLKVKAVKLNLKPGGGVTDQENKSSFKLVDAALLGEDVFQLRVIVLGRDIGEKSLNRVKVALHQAQDGHADALNQLRHLGQLSVAQAEYFTTEANGKDQDAEEVRRTWMWTPHWRARLRRVWIPAEFSSATKSHGDADLTMLSKDTPRVSTIEAACQNARGSSGEQVDTTQCGAARERGGLRQFVRELSDIFIH